MVSPKTSAPVLLTGITSFVGTTLAREFVERGYTVRGTVRSKDKFDKWLSSQPNLKGKVDYVVVEDVGAAGAFDKPEVWADGVEFVAHTASPFHLKVNDPEKDFLRPAIEGTTGLLKSAAKAKSVKRIVITSSFAAVIDLDKGSRPGYSYTEADWNPATRESAVNYDRESPLLGPYVYSASKKLAEDAAWQFVEKEKPGFTLTTINPPLILGPPEQPVSLDNLNTSSEDVWTVIGGSNKGKDVPQTGFPICVDVRDVALAHIRALEIDEAQGQRFLTSAGQFFNEDYVSFAKTIPELKDRQPNLESDWKAPDVYLIDASKSRKILGINYRQPKQVIEDTIRALVKIEKESK